MEDFRRDVISYVTRLVEERLFYDPRRLEAVRELAVYFNTHPQCTRLQRKQMIRETFDDRNHDLAQVYFRISQEQHDPDSLLAPPVEKLATLIKIAKACFCVQLMDLYRQRLPVQSPYYLQLSNSVNQLVADRLPLPKFCADLRHLNHVFRQVPDFRNRLEARVNRLTSLFRPPRAANHPGPANPPPQI